MDCIEEPLNSCGPRQKTSEQESNGHTRPFALARELDATVRAASCVLNEPQHPSLPASGRRPPRERPKVSVPACPPPGDRSRH